MKYQNYLCLHCGEELSSPPEKEEGYWFLRCLACGARNILAEHPLPSSLEPDTEDLLIGYIDAQA
jgi:DNA-directed RNA polymerase subunit RPC12/RpoP